MTCYIEIVCLQKIFIFLTDLGRLLQSHWQKPYHLYQISEDTQRKSLIYRINSYIYLSVICIEQRIQLMTSNYILKRDDLQGEKYGLRIDLCGTP